MTSYKNHLQNYRSFKKDAENPENFIGTRVEVYFLAAYHLIDACAALYNVHINKHQKMREILSNNQIIFGGFTDQIWKLFQSIETRLRSKFVYGSSGNQEDLDEIQQIFDDLEKICLEMIQNVKIDDE